MKRLIGSVVVTAALAFTGLVVVPSADAATTGYVYVVVNNRVCGSNQVRGILASVDQTGWTSPSWDNGDNIIYPKVRFGVSNTFSAEVACYKRVLGIFWQKVGYAPVQGRFTPSKTGQTFWVG